MNCITIKENNLVNRNPIGIISRVLRASKFDFFAVKSNIGKLVGRSYVLPLAVVILGAIMSCDSRAQTNKTVAYSANTNGVAGTSGGGGLNIGHTFTIYQTNLQVYSLGVYDYLGNGLSTSHTVSLFINNNGNYTPVTGGSVVVPAGTGATLSNGYRFVALSSPITLPDGNYAVVAYQMNGGLTSDGYENDNGDNGFSGFAGLYNTGSVYEFSTNPGPTFPASANLANGVNFGSASFTYTPGSPPGSPVDAPRISPASLSVDAGSTVVLTATDNGTFPIRFQWYYGGTTNPIAGATNSILVLSNVQPVQTSGNAGSYVVSAQNAYGGPVLSTNPAQALLNVIPIVPPVKIMPIGDSITDGMLSIESGYRGPLYKLLADANVKFSFVGSQSDNAVSWLPYPNHEGISGSEINSVTSGFPIWGPAYTPDIVLLLIGTNDYGYNDNTSNAINRLDNLIGLMATNQPNAKLIIANLIVRNDSLDHPGVEAAIQSTFNPYVPIVVSNHFALGQHVYFVDMHSALTTSDLGDGLHPNQVGYNKLANKWFNTIMSVIPAPAHTNASLSFTGTTAALNYQSVPGFQYVTQRSTNLGIGGWQNISTNTVPVSGAMQILDNFSDLGGVPPKSAVYKLLLQL